MRIQGLFAASVLLVVCSSSARADVLVVPNTSATVEGNDDNFGPFFSNSVRYQQVYSASQFPSSMGPLLITQIAFRPDGAVTDPFLFVVATSVRMDLSTTSSAPATLSTVFANNVGADNKTVFDNFVFLKVPVTGPPGGPKDFTVTFATNPFLYDPSAGNLLLDVRTFQSGGGISAALDAESNSPFMAHVDAPSIAAPTGGFFVDGLVTQFQFTSIPEPSTVLSSLVALVAGVARWRQCCSNRPLKQ